MFLKKMPPVTTSILSPLRLSLYYLNIYSALKPNNHFRP